MTKSCIVEEGDRVAQLVIEKIETPSVVEVDVCGIHVLYSSIDIVLRISRQPSAGKMALAQQEDILLFSSLPKHLVLFNVKSRGSQPKFS